MTIRISVRSDPKPLDGYAAFLRNVQRANSDILRMTAQKNINVYLRPMEQVNPGPSQHGARAGAWSTDPAADARARRWWFANYPNGRARTGNLNRAWVLVTRGNRLSLENNSRGAAYVFSFAQTPRARGGRPNPGHIRTGWPQAVRRVGLEVMDMILGDVQLAYSRSIAASVATGQFRVVIP